MTEDRLDKIFTLAEAAERLRLNRNALARLARRTGHCAQAGRTLLFSESDLVAIWEEMRVPAKPVKSEPSPYTSLLSPQKRSALFLMFRPKTVDRRVLEILRWLADQRSPKTFAAIERCGPRTVENLLERQFVDNCGQDAEGRIRVRINASGRGVLKEYDAWAERERKRRGG